MNRTKLAALSFWMVMLVFLACNPRPNELTAIPPPESEMAEETTPPTEPSSSQMPPTEPTIEPTITLVPQCVPDPPPGWVPYTIRSGDTLSVLAANTKTSVAALQQVNCIENASIIDLNDVIYLPYIPTATPAPTNTSTPIPTTEEVASCEGIACPGDNVADLPDTNFAPGGPNDPDFLPCKSLFTAHMEFDTTRHIVELGVRRYIYVCNFTPVAAEVVRLNSSGNAVETFAADILTTHPNPENDLKDATAILDWPALPEYEIGSYRAIATDGTGQTIMLDFEVDPPQDQKLMVIPESGPPGTVFQVYLTGFDFQSSVEAVLYGKVASPDASSPCAGQPLCLTPLMKMEVDIDNELIYTTDRGSGTLVIITTQVDSENTLALLLPAFPDVKEVVFWLAED